MVLVVPTKTTNTAANLMNSVSQFRQFAKEELSYKNRVKIWHLRCGGIENFDPLRLGENA